MARESFKNESSSSLPLTKACLYSGRSIIFSGFEKHLKKSYSRDKYSWLKIRQAIIETINWITIEMSIRKVRNGNLCSPFSSSKNGK